MTIRKDVKEYLTEKNPGRILHMKEWNEKHPVLFRYRSINETCEYEFTALEKGDIYSSTFDKLNDDDEAMLLMELISKLPGSIKQKARTDFKRMRRKYGVSCFTEISPEHKDADYMWDNYASFGQGICIQYRFSDFIEKEYFLIPVTYVDKVQFEEYCMLGHFIAELAYATKHRSGNDKNGNKKEWCREREWRHIEELSEEEGQYCGIEILPEKIYCGKALEEKYVQRIIEIYPNIEIVRK